MPEQMGRFQKNLDFIIEKENNLEQILEKTKENIGRILENTKKELSDYSNGRPDPPEIVPKHAEISSLQPQLGLIFNNIGGYPDTNYNQTAIQWPLADSFKEFSDPSSLKIEAISWYQSLKDIDCLQLKFPNGIESPVFGNTAELPDKSFQIPAGVRIGKISFYHRKFSSTRLGCI